MNNYIARIKFYFQDNVTISIYNYFEKGTKTNYLKLKKM